MHIRVHKPVICQTCKSEMAEYPAISGWFKCIICGDKRLNDS